MNKRMKHWIIKKMGGIPGKDIEGMEERIYQEEQARKRMQLEILIFDLIKMVDKTTKGRLCIKTKVETDDLGVIQYILGEMEGEVINNINGEIKKELYNQLKNYE